MDPHPQLLPRDSRPLITHVVLLRFRPEVGDQTLTAIGDGLLALRNLVPEIRRITFGPNLAPEREAWPWVVMVDVDDLPALERYAVHPAHQRVLTDLVRPNLEARLAADVEIAGRES